ncbi:cytochrome P450 [Streptomyces sp. SID3212]|uniref:cytochrome P450 n=1 Tax=Streptomyces sp. SID3212 TaxID=2690259 RepID=UPI00136E3E80|nr:cytochrome P450 [Streptomyces sp. SID3212]MYV54800.1 cytochrome P450 [Streptomyces sp. SID3212]
MTTDTPAASAPAQDTPDTEGDARPVRFWAVPDLSGLDFDPFLAERLSEDPVSRIRLPHGEGFAWLITRYEDVKLVTNDARFSRQALVGREVTRLAPHFIPLDAAVGFADPPDHTRLRRPVAKAFTSRALAGVEERARRIMDDLVDGMLRAGAPADLMERINGPFPLAVVSEIMGVPEHDRPLMRKWTEALLSAAHSRAHSERAKAEIGAYFTDLIGRRRTNGGDDLAAVLAQAVEADELSLGEAVAIAVLIQVSGAHAVTNNSANMIYALLTHPAHMARLRAEPGLLPAAVEELLRFIPHRNGVGLARVATEDVTVRGVRIRAGEAVYASYLTANRDPDVFADPGRLDFDRGPTPHLAFGHGPHYCVGPTLARLESRIMIASLLERLPRLRLAVPRDEVRWRRGALIRGPEALPVLW